MTKIPSRFSILKTIVVTGGLILNAFRGRVENIPKKSDLPTDKVKESSTAHTLVDDLVQDIALEILYTNLPEVRINVEEETSRTELFKNNKSGLCFHLDPLDGTLAYLKNRDDFAIGAAFSHDLQFVASAIYFPVLDRLYYAEKGQGVRLLTGSGSELVFSRPDKAADRYVQKRCDDLLPIVQEMGLQPFDTLSAHHGMIAIAEGNARVEMYHMASPHDFGIPKVIVEEAGGICTDLAGNPIVFTPKFRRLPYLLAFYDRKTSNEFFNIFKKEKK
ncbi:MAG: inositol monophosphatase family protein [Candidatus Heimdallarchaeota archaeon]